MTPSSLSTSMVGESKEVSPSSLLGISFRTSSNPLSLSLSIKELKILLNERFLFLLQYMCMTVNLLVNARKVQTSVQCLFLLSNLVGFRGFFLSECSS